MIADLVKTQQLVISAESISLCLGQGDSGAREQNRRHYRERESKEIERQQQMKNNVGCLHAGGGGKML